MPSTPRKLFNTATHGSGQSAARGIFRRAYRQVFHTMDAEYVPVQQSTSLSFYEFTATDEQMAELTAALKAGTDASWTGVPWSEGHGERVKQVTAESMIAEVERVAECTVRQDGSVLHKPKTISRRREGAHFKLRDNGRMCAQSTVYVTPRKRAKVIGKRKA